MHGTSDVTTPQADLKFEIDSSVVFQLGESLISDDVQAMVELLKNCYDADSLSAKVTIETQEGPGAESAFSDSIGFIRVEDNGSGMDFPTIRDGWLFISSSPKRALKAVNGVTKKNRTPLGDKGLGRLSTQRLGDNLEIFTRSASEDVEHYVAFSWSAFRNASRLSDVKVTYEERPPQRQNGTELIISGLRDASEWEGKAALERLETRLSELVSPFLPPQQFSVTAIVNSERVELASIATRVRQAANLQFLISFDGSTLRVEGHVSKDFFRPAKRSSQPDRQAYEELIEIDGGEQLAGFLAQHRGGVPYSVRTTTGDWLLDFDMEIGLEDVQPKLVDGTAANPGPFHGEINSFSLDAATADIDVFNTVSDLRSYVRDLSGVKVYRDGFGIHVDRDWLKLGAQWISGRSWYTLRPEGTIGFIALSAKDNARLEETTDREGFKVNAYYENFYKLLLTFVQRSGLVMEFFGRAWVEYRRGQQVPEPTARALSPQELISTVRKTYSDAVRHSDAMGQIAERLSTEIRATESSLARRPRVAGDEPLVNELDDLVGRLGTVLSECREALRQAQAYLAELQGQMPLVELLDSKVQLLQEQLGQTHELVGLGITAEALSHEITAAVDQLQHRTRDVVEHLKTSKIADPKLSGYFTYISSTIGSLRKQIGHLAPAFRFARERRETVDLRVFCSDLAEYHSGRLRSQRILVSVEDTGSDAFQVVVNRGKLTQIFDNLILNSEFWLAEDIRMKRISEGAIKIALHFPKTVVSDNGRGVDPLVDESLFEPFVTTKPTGVGRGLGLFIVSQLLESEGGNIQLLSERNSFGRRYKFELDLKALTRG